MDGDATLEALMRLEAAHAADRADVESAEIVAAFLRTEPPWPPVLLERLEAALGCEAVMEGLPPDVLFAHAKSLDGLEDRYDDTGPAACAEPWRATERAAPPAAPPPAPYRGEFRREWFVGLEGGAGAMASKEAVRTAWLARGAVWSWYPHRTNPIGGGATYQAGPVPAAWLEARTQGWGWGVSAGFGATLTERSPSVRLGAELIPAKGIVLGGVSAGLEAWGRYDSGAAVASGVSLNLHVETRYAGPFCGTPYVGDDFEAWRALSRAERHAWNEEAEAWEAPPEPLAPLAAAAEARAEACELAQRGLDGGEWLRQAVLADPWFRYVEGDGAPAVCIERYEAARVK